MARRFKGRWVKITSQDVGLINTKIETFGGQEKLAKYLGVTSKRITGWLRQSVKWRTGARAEVTTARYIAKVKVRHPQGLTKGEQVLVRDMMKKDKKAFAKSKVSKKGILKGIPSSDMAKPKKKVSKGVRASSNGLVVIYDRLKELEGGLLPGTRPHEKARDIRRDLACYMVDAS